MQLMPVIQATLLRGMGTTGQIQRNFHAMAVCADIRRLQDRVAVTDRSRRFVDEVQRKLACVGLLPAESVA